MTQLEAEIKFNFYARIFAYSREAVIAILYSQYNFSNPQKFLI